MHEYIDIVISFIVWTFVIQTFFFASHWWWKPNHTKKLILNKLMFNSLTKKKKRCMHTQTHSFAHRKWDRQCENEEVGKKMEIESRKKLEAKTVAPSTFAMFSLDVCTGEQNARPFLFYTIFSSFITITIKSLRNSLLRTYSPLSFCRLFSSI